MGEKGVRSGSEGVQLGQLKRAGSGCANTPPPAKELELPLQHDDTRIAGSPQTIPTTTESSEWLKGYEAGLADQRAMLMPQIESGERSIQHFDAEVAELKRRLEDVPGAFAAFADSVCWDMTYGEGHTPDGEPAPVWVISPDTLKRFASIYHTYPYGAPDADTDAWWEQAEHYALTGDLGKAVKS